MPCYFTGISDMRHLYRLEQQFHSHFAVFNERQGIEFSLASILNIEIDIWYIDIYPYCRVIPFQNILFQWWWINTVATFSLIGSIHPPLLGYKDIFYGSLATETFSYIISPLLTILENICTVSFQISAKNNFKINPIHWFWRT